MSFIAPLAIFLLGIAIGSFLCAVLWRLRTRESFVIAYSYCPSCKKTLGWKDLIPLVSYFLLRGHCRYCRKPISWQYPMIELVTGLLFVAAFYLQGNGALLLRDWLAIAVFIAVFVFDLRYSLIPRALVVPTSVVVLFLGFIGGEGLLSGIFGALLAAGFFGLQYLFSHGRWIGFGDVTLGLFMGCVLGLQRTVVALFVAYVVAAIFALGLLALKKTKWKTEIPFGTFLSVGSVAALFFGDRIVEWYLSLL